MQQGNTSTRSCLIVGAGVAGLIAARALRERGVRVTLLEKGNQAGGRLAVRKIEAGVFDSGAQFFTARDPRFGERVRRWEAEGIVSEWCRGFADAAGNVSADGHPRYRCEGGMAALAEHLARGEVQTGTRIVAVEQRDGRWIARTQNGALEAAEALLLTPPAPQSLLLLNAGGVPLPSSAREALEAIAYEPCLAVLALLDGPSGLPHPGGLQIGGEPIAWIADNQQKGISPRACGLTIHAGPEFSRTQGDADDLLVIERLLEAARRWLGAPVRTAQVERWRYAKPVHLHPERCLFVDGPPLAFAGDAFAAPRVEGATLSGLAAAVAIAAALGKT